MQFFFNQELLSPGNIVVSNLNKIINKKIKNTSRPVRFVFN